MSCNSIMTESYVTYLLSTERTSGHCFRRGKDVAYACRRVSRRAGNSTGSLD